VADDGTSGPGLWRTDGTIAGTNKVSNADARSLTNLNGTLVFEARDSEHGYELWRSDGTPEGTKLLVDIQSGAGSSLLYETMYVHGNSVYFAADDGIHGRELWRSDGTKDGTALVRDLIPGRSSSSPQDFISLGEELLFQARSAGSVDDALWKTNGTQGGTQIVKTNVDIVEPLGVFDGRAWFVNREPSEGLYTSDGTEAGTLPFFSSTRDLGKGAFLEFGGKLFFGIHDAEFGTELYRSDGTVAGTGLFVDINSTTVESYADEGFLSFREGVVFLAKPLSRQTHSGPTSVWYWDPTASAANPIQLLGGGWEVHNITVEGSRVFMLVDESPQNASGLFVFDGQTDKVSQVAIFQGRSHSLAAANGRVFFVLSTSIEGEELWTSDGTEDGTYMVSDIRPGRNSSLPKNLAVTGDTLYFSADDGVHGREPWKTDGTPEGTTLVEDINPGPASSIGAADFIYVSGPTVYLSANDGVHGRELWRVDSDGEGASLVADIRPGSAGAFEIFSSNRNSSHTPPVGFREFIVFFANDGVHGTELWKSDGTASGTTLLKDIAPGSRSSNDSRHFVGTMAVLGDILVFEAEDGRHGHELWHSDGTTNGTTLLRDIHLRGESAPLGMSVVGSMLYFSADDGTHGRELWLTDGTYEGTRLVADINVLDAGFAGSFPGAFVAVGNQVIFWADDGIHGTEPWTFELLPKVFGDYDRDGVVDQKDFDFWKQHFGATYGVGLQADGNGDGIVDAADYVVWRRNVGKSILPSQASVHPVDEVADNGVDTAALSDWRGRLRSLQSRYSGVDDTRTVGRFAVSKVLASGNGDSRNAVADRNNLIDRWMADLADRHRDRLNVDIDQIAIPQSSSETPTALPETVDHVYEDIGVCDRL
jgi:ELWxxDGT repeat protein